MLKVKHNIIGGDCLGKQAVEAWRKRYKKWKAQNEQTRTNQKGTEPPKETRSS